MDPVAFNPTVIKETEAQKQSTTRNQVEERRQNREKNRRREAEEWRREWEERDEWEENQKESERGGAKREEEEKGKKILGLTRCSAYVGWLGPMKRNTKWAFVHQPKNCEADGWKRT